MRKKLIITVILSVLVFLSACALGVSNVYRVDYVTVDAPMASDAAKEEARVLQKRLTETYKGESMLFLDENEAAEVFAEFPYFRMTGFTKDYPNRLVIEATEDAEVYAVPSDKEGFCILSGEGTVLGIREDTSNRVDGGANVIIEGVTESSESLSYILAFCKTADELLGGIRSNVATVTKIGSGATEYLSLQMREGIKVYVMSPSELTEEKAEKLIELYLSLDDQKRLGGCIVATSGEKGVSVEYFSNDLVD